MVFWICGVVYDVSEWAVVYLGGVGVKTALVTGGTGRDIAAMAVLALNIRETNGKWIDELVIFHDGIGEEDQKLVKKIFPARFEKYKCPIGKWKQIQNKSVRYFTSMVFCKYECFRLLNDYDVVTWSDYDIIIKEDISEIVKGQEDINIVVNQDEKLCNMFFKSIEKRDMSEYDMNGPCICTPLFVLKKGIQRYEEYYKWCYRMTDRFIKDLYLPEQCIMTMLVQKYKLPLGRIDRNIYAVHPKEDSSVAKILHAYGAVKFWNGLSNEKWENYYQQWLAMGGSII